MRRVRQTLDTVDRQLCELMIADPRASNRALAAAVGVTDETVAARLRRLRDLNILGTSVAVDWQAAGYQVGAMIRIKLDGRSASDFVAGLDHDGVVLVAKTSGCCDVVVALVATDMTELRRNILRWLRSRSGIGEMTVDVVTETCRYNLRDVTLPAPVWSPADLPAPAPELDDLDRALIEALASDGHQSNRALARNLDISDGTVRARIKRLEDGGLLRIIAGVDPIATGELRATGLAFLTLDDNGEAIAELLEVAPLLTAQRLVGSADFVMMLGATQEHALDVFLVDDLRSVEGVRSVEVAYVVEVWRHQSHLVRLLD